MKNILITGGAGFIGTNLALVLSKNNHVVCIDNMSRKGSMFNANVLTKKSIDVTHLDIVDKETLLTLDKMDIIIHCAAIPSVMAGYQDAAKMIETNLIGTINCLEFARKHGSDFIFISTNRVYPIDGKIRSLYGATKLSSEHLLIEYANMFGFRYVINRPSIVAGPYQRGDLYQGLIGYWIKQHLYGGDLDYIGYHGYQVRDALHIDDFCSLISWQIKNFDKVNAQTFNIGGGPNNAFTLRKLTKIVRQITGINKSIGEQEKRPCDFEQYITDNTIVTEDTGWKPTKKLREIVTDTYNWMKGIPNGV